MRNTQSDKAVANFTLAVDRSKDGADYINCVAWNKTAELLEKYVKKGDKIGLIGRIQTRTYDDNNGRKVYVTEVVADEIEFLTPKPKEEKPVQDDDEFVPF